jgi:hypothetical protein
MAHNFQRPGLPYDNESLDNDKRYQIITRSDERPATDVMLDTDFNYVIDGLRQLDIDIAGIAKGILPGADIEANANLLPTTDGAGNISWIDISDVNIRDSSVTGSRLFAQAITVRELGDGSVTTPKLATNSVTTIKILDFNVTANKLAVDSVLTDKIVDLNVTSEKLAADSVTTDKIVDLNVTSEKLAADSVTTDKIVDLNVTDGKLADSAVTTPKLANRAVTGAKTNSEAAAIGSVLTADGAGAASFLPNMGKILQIESYGGNVKLLTTANTPIGNAFSFTTPFTVSITPLSSTSRIFLFVSASYSLEITSSSFLAAAALKLFVNNTQFSTNNEAYQWFADNVNTAFFSSLIPIGNQGEGVQLSMEIKGICPTENYNVVLGGIGTGATFGLPYYMHAIEIDI